MTDLLFLVGTRPEAIKVAPLILRAKEMGVRHKVALTGQHQQIPAEILEWFGLKADERFSHNLDSSIVNQLTLFIGSVQKCIQMYNPKVVLAQGDTTTVLAGALACFYNRKCFAHLEAGLRTIDSYKPFPEEMHRRLVSQIALYNFVPTLRAAQNLAQEQIPKANIFVSGNSVVDALKFTTQKLNNMGIDLKKRGQVLVTAHRRDNFGEPMKKIALAVKTIANKYSLDIYWVMHPNPKVEREVRSNLGESSNITFLKPLSYPELITEVLRSIFVITDSGGLQEECATLGVPILILREETERPEVLEAGIGFLVGCNPELIVQKAKNLIDNASNPFMPSQVFGEGKTGEIVIRTLKRYDFSNPS